MACGEFSLVARYFDRVGSSHLDVELSIGDDCALLNIPEKQALVISAGTLVADNHFLPDIDPAGLAYRALAVNLSDLAAMGTDPAQLTLTLTLPDVDEAWLESFSDSLSDLLNYYDMQLISGDITRGPLSMTLDIHGSVPMGRALARSGAGLGNWIYVTGTPGDSAAGLVILQDRLRIADAKDTDYLIKHHLRPSPRILQGQALRDLTNSAIDLSGGLVSDFGHIVEANDCDTHIDLTLLPFFDTLSRYVESEQALRWALSGDEDYELRFAVPELNRGALDVAFEHLGVSFTCIGQVTAGIEGFCFIHDDEPAILDWKGYDHFVTP